MLKVGSDDESNKSSGKSPIHAPAKEGAITALWNFALDVYTDKLSKGR